MAAPKKAPEPAWIGHVLAVPLHEGGYGAIQILPSPGDGTKHGSLTAVALDAAWAAPPSLAEAIAAGPMKVRDGEFQAVITGASKPPRRYIDLGVAPPIDIGPVNSYGSFDGFPIWIRYELRRRARQRANPDDPRLVVWRHDPAVIDVPLGPYTLKQRRDSGGVQIGPPEVPNDARIDWSALDALPQLRAITYEGADTGVFDYIARTPRINELRLTIHGTSKLDLSSLPIEKLSLNNNNNNNNKGELREVHIGAALESLTLHAPSGELRVVHAHAGAGMELVVTSAAEIPGAIAGLSRLRSYSQAGLRRATVENLLGYVELESLRLCGAPGALVDPENLTRLAKLDNVTLNDFYELDAARLPTAAEAPSISDLHIHGFRSSNGPILKQRLAGFWLSALGGGKKDEWIADNANNPFRDWTDRSAAMGKKACLLFKETLRALREATSVARVAELTRAFVAGLNALDAKYGLETTEREDAFDALHALLTASPVAIDRAALEQMFDEARTF